MDLEKVMSEVGVKQKNRTFKKRSHRPWKTALLETTIEEATIDADDDSLIELDLDLEEDLAFEADTSEDNDSFYPELNLHNQIIISKPEKSPFIEKISQLQNIEIDLEKYELDSEDVNLELKQEIRSAQHQKRLLEQQISDKSDSSILLGGFFQPQQVVAQSDSKAGRKINSLLSELKVREQKLNYLTNNLKLSEAIERAEQAELYKKAASHGRQAAEQRMRQAIEQANVASEQFRSAMEQANQAALAQQEEANLRKNAEAQAKEARLRANNAEIELQNERLARLSAEEKSQQAFTAAERANLLQKQLQESIDLLQKQLKDATEQASNLELVKNSEINKRLEIEKQIDTIKNSESNKRLEIEKQYDALHDDFIKIENEYRLCNTTIKNLENSVKSLTEQLESSQQKIQDFDAQRENLKTIIATEQELRKAAERKYNEVLKRAQTAEEGWQLEVQQRKIIEERAKRAVAHASKTVMHLLNAPPDNEFNLKITEQDSDYGLDDFKF